MTAPRTVARRVSCVARRVAPSRPRSVKRASRVFNFRRLHYGLFRLVALLHSIDRLVDLGVQAFQAGVELFVVVQRFAQHQ